jgi:hypothetical protein
VLLIYYSHSYRKTDDNINEFFQELMIDESLSPSLDPPSDHLNSAKPERHMRGTDGMIAVLTFRDPKPSEYIRYEISLGVRARKPLLVFVEDVLPDDVLPLGISQRRFSRRWLLREVREHRHAMALLRTYIGENPPPAFHMVNEQRRCLVVGSANFDAAQLDALTLLLSARQYSPRILKPGTSILDGSDDDSFACRAALCIAATENLTPSEAYLLGATRSALTPAILLTLDSNSTTFSAIPKEYQPRFIHRGDTSGLVGVLQTEIDIFEEDYLELADAEKVRLYRSTLLQTHRGDGRYHEISRSNLFNIVAGSVGVDMSKDKIEISHVVGPINIKSTMDRVVQTVQNAPALPDNHRQELQNLITELRAELAKIGDMRPDDTARVAQSAEIVVTEATKKDPNKGFLAITAEGLKEAAKAVADIAPTVLAVAARVAAFVTGVA